MPLDINKSPITSRIYHKTEVIGLETWRLKHPKSMNSDTTYDIYEKVIHQNQHGKIIKIIAISFTFFSLGLALISQKIRDIWKQVIESKQVKTIKIYSDQRINKNVETSNFVQPISSKPTATQESQTPSKEVLPNLLNLKLEETHPLNTPLSMEAFVLPALLTHSSLEPYNEFDKALLYVPLAKWAEGINRLAMSYLTAGASSDIAMKRYLNYNSLTQENSLLFQRINDLEENLQLKERLSRLRNPLYIQLQDLIPSWNNNPCKFMLMMDVELRELELSKIPKTTKFNPGFTNRIKELSKQRSTSSNALSLENIRLIDATHITAVQVNANHKKLPNIVFSLLSKKEVSKIDTKALSDDEVNALFSEKDLVQNLTKKQIDECFSKISLKVLSFLSEEQILNLDSKLDHSKIDRTSFDAIFKLPNAKITNCLKKLPLNKIYALSPLFSNKHFEVLSDDYDKLFDPSKFLSNETLTPKAIFECFYPAYSESKRKRLNDLPLERVYELLPYFSEKHFEVLKDDYVKQFDPSKFLSNETLTPKAIFECFYPAYSESKRKRLNDLPLERVYELLPYFSENHFEVLKDDYVEQFDPSKFLSHKTLRPKAIFECFYPNYSLEKRERLNKLTAEKLKALIDYFSDKHFSVLTDKQIVDLKDLINEKNLMKNLMPRQKKLINS